MSTHRLACLPSPRRSLFCALIALAACAGSAPGEPAPDAAPPIDPAGRFAITSTYSLAAVPAPAAGVLDELVAATDGADDPSRYLIDLMIERLPEGQARTYATAVAPYVAAYINERLELVAPRFAAGARALATGMLRIAQRFGTIETFEIASDGGTRASEPGEPARAAVAGSPRALRRTIVGLRFDLHAGREIRDVSFEPLGLPDVTAATFVALAGERLTIDSHAAALPYAALLRLGLDHAVIPSVVPGAHDLGEALRGLVDCPMLGALTAEWIGLGAPGFYQQACDVGLTALAARLYARIDAIDAAALPLELAGEARAVDADADGALDGLEAGVWTGSFADVSVTGTFAGAAP